MAKKTNETLSRLALQLSSSGEANATFLLQQAEGRMRLRTKVPSWAAIDELHYPHRLALEQCSGEEAARYKATVVSRLLSADERHTLVDLTGGLGVDFSFIAPLFKKNVYVERQAELCDLARHNLPLLGLPEAQVVCADGVDYLQNELNDDEASLLFLDPARRDTAGRKTVLIEDCQPDVCALRDTLLQRARVVMIKLSPMLDIAAAVRSLQCVAEVHVVATGGECKDLLLILTREALQQGGTTPTLYAHEGEERDFRFTLEEETTATPAYATQLGQYLYEPGAAVLKAGAFKSIATHYGLQKLHSNTHLYTADNYIATFPGRSFHIVQVLTFSKADLKTLRTSWPKANLSVRNFPATVDALRKKLKIKDGGQTFLFATTMADNQHFIIICEKADEKK